MDTIEMIKYNGATYIYNNKTYDLYILGQKSCQHLSEVSKAKEDNCVCFDAEQRVSVNQSFSFRLPIDESQIYNKQSKAYLLENGNHYEIDMENMIAYGPLIPNKQCKIENATITQDGRLKIYLAGAYKGGYILTAPIERVVSLQEYTYNCAINNKLSSLQHHSLNSHYRDTIGVVI